MTDDQKRTAIIVLEGACCVMAGVFASLLSAFVVAHL